MKISTSILLFVVFILFTFSTTSWAVDDDCGDQEMTIDYMRVIGSIDSVGNPFSNMLLLKFNKTCRGTNYAYIKKDDEMFNSILSTALAAYMSSKPVYPAVTSSSTISAGSLIAEKILWLQLQR